MSSSIGNKMKKSNGTSVSSSSSSSMRNRRSRTDNDELRANGTSRSSASTSAAGRLLLGLLLVSSSGTNGRFNDSTAAAAAAAAGGTGTALAGTTPTPFVMGMTGVAAAAAAAASTNVAAAPAAARRAASRRVATTSTRRRPRVQKQQHHQQQQRPVQQQRSQRPRNHHRRPRQVGADHHELYQGQRDRGGDCVVPPDPVRTSTSTPRSHHARGRPDTLLGVPPVRIRSASGGIAFLPPEMVTVAATGTETERPSRHTTGTGMNAVESATGNYGSIPSAVRSRTHRAGITSPCPPSNDDDIQDNPINGNDGDACTRSTSSSVGTSSPTGVADSTGTAGMFRNHHHHHHHHRSSTASSAMDFTGRTRTANTSSRRRQDRSTARGATRAITTDRNGVDNAAGVAGEGNIPCGSSRGTRMSSGLLRVPCSIGICMEEHHQHHRRHRRDRYRHASSRIEGPTSSLRAFVDTGAEVTVMSAEAAQRAGLLHLLDRRYAGRATGVGSCRVLGRLPAGCATLILGKEFGNEAAGGDGEDAIAMPCPHLTVLEETGTDDVDLLIGLDVLDEYGASISLRGCTLTMDQSPTMRVSSASSTEPPAQRIVIALARNNSSGDVSNHNNNETSEQSSVVPSFSAPLSNSGALVDVGHRLAPGTNSADRGGWSACRRRGRKDDDDLIADLELLEQEASCSHSSSESDWAEEEMSHKTSFPRMGLVGGQEEENGGGGGGDEEDTDEESEEYEDDDDDNFDMSGV